MPVVSEKAMEKSSFGVSAFSKACRKQVLVFSPFLEKPWKRGVRVYCEKSSKIILIFLPSSVLVK